MNLRDLDFGVRIIEGPPGSGKSLIAVREAVGILMRTRRPFYTNMPIRWRLLRWYLKLRGGPRLANLVVELKEEHFKRFLKRAALKRDHKRKLKRMVGGPTDAEIGRLFQREYGPHVVREYTDDELVRLKAAALERFKRASSKRVEDGRNTREAHHSADDYRNYERMRGVEPNWIPEGAFVVLDEVQLIYPMANQKHEGSELLGYLSMHRHHFHMVWALTQEATNISISFRKVAQYWVRARDASLDPIIWGFQLRWLGIKCLRYECFTKEQMEGKGFNNLRPIWRKTLFTQWPTEQFWFRIYESFTQQGSERDAIRAMRRARNEAGLTDEGEDERNVQMPKVTVSQFAKSRLVLLPLGLFGALCLFLLAYSCGARGRAAVQHKGGVPEGAVAKQSQSVAAVDLSWPSLDAVGKDPNTNDGFVVLSKKRVPSGGVYENMRILGGSATERMCVVERGGNIWVWKLGEQPRNIGPVATALALVQRLGNVPGGSAPDAGTFGSKAPGVGTPQDHSGVRQGAGVGDR